MTCALFFDRLKRLYSYTGKTVGRKASLFVNKCSAHGTNDSLPILDIVEVIYLPPNTKSKLQPLDAGMTALMKLRYRRVQMERAIDAVNENVEHI